MLPSYFRKLNYIYSVVVRRKNKSRQQQQQDINSIGRCSMVISYDRMRWAHTIYVQNLKSV